MRIGYLECFSGISGDMLLGAVVDAGVPFPLLEETAAGLHVGARLELRKVMRGGLAASKVDVITEEGATRVRSGERITTMRTPIPTPDRMSTTTTTRTRIPVRMHTSIRTPITARFQPFLASLPPHRSLKP